MEKSIDSELILDPCPDMMTQQSENFAHLTSKKVKEFCEVNFDLHGIDMTSGKNKSRVD